MNALFHNFLKHKAICPVEIGIRMPKMSKENMALICVSLGWFLIFSGRLSISTILVTIEKSFDINHAEAGLALTGMWFFYGLMQFPSGVISDLKGRKVTILASMAIFSVAYLLIGLSVHYLMLFLMLILLGIGGGSFPTAGIAMLSDIFKERRGKALGIQASFGSMAGFMPIVAPVIASFNWRLFFFIWAGLGIFAMYLFLRCTEESTKLPHGESILKRFVDGAAALRDRKILFIFAINLVATLSWIGYISFFPTYLIESKAFSEMEAGVSFAILTLGGFILKPIIGSLSDRYDKKAIMLFLMSTSAIATVLLVYLHSFITILGVSFTLSASSAFFLVANSYLLGLWGERGRGGRLGFYRSLLILTGSHTSAVIGFYAAKGGFALPFLVIALLLSIAALLLLMNIALECHARR